jgi:hypothetical protein
MLTRRLGRLPAKPPRKHRVPRHQPVKLVTSELANGEGTFLSPTPNKHKDHSLRVPYNKTIPTLSLALPPLQTQPGPIPPRHPAKVT